MQVCTTVSGNTEVIASGKPLSPSTTAIRMSLTPRALSSLTTLSQKLGSLALLDPQSQYVLLAVGIEGERDIDGLVLDQAFIADLDRRASKTRLDRPGRAAGSAIFRTSSSTASVTRLMRSGETSVP